MPSKTSVKSTKSKKTTSKSSVKSSSTSKSAVKKTPAKKTRPAKTLQKPSLAKTSEQYKAKAKELFEFAQNLEAEKAIAYLNNCVAKNYKLYLEDPIVKAEGVWLYTRKGRKIFDGVSAYSAANLGHNHPLVAEMIRLCLNSKSPTVLGRFLPSTWLGLLGKKITEMTGFEKYIPTNGGVEAPETALKLARRWGSVVKKIEGTPEIIWCTGAFHGRTITMTQFFNDEPEAYNGFGPFPQGFIEIPYGDIEAVKKVITPRTAAILVEPIQGEGGINIPPDSYFPALRKLANENNFLIIFDEVQTGWGRTGKLFAWEYLGNTCRPDIMCVAKSLSAGYAPVGGVLADAKIMDLFTPGSHGSTFGGAPLSAAIAYAALNAIQIEKLPERSMKMGAYATKRLEEIAKKSKHILRIRSKGLFIGIEVHHEGHEAHHFAHLLCDEGVICKDTNKWVLRFTPPLVASKEELDYALDIIEKIFLHD